MARNTRRNRSWTFTGLRPALILIVGAFTLLHAQEEPMTDIPDIILTTVAYPAQGSEQNAVLLVESIRSFGGALSRAAVWCFVPDNGRQPSEWFTRQMSALGVKVIPFAIDKEVARFFFAGDIRAAAHAESMAVGRTRLLAWLGSNTIVLQEPAGLLLDENTKLGYRPVHHTNVGSHYDQPIDAFWTLIYSFCGATEDRQFPMKTHVDDVVIRPYFNAGILVTRPENGLFRRWHDRFFDAYQAPEFTAFYERDERYAIFIHQALLSGVILAHFRPDEIQELPPGYNYPLHLFDQDSTAHRPSAIGGLVTVRYEDPAQIPDWFERMEGGAAFRQWLADRTKHQE